MAHNLLVRKVGLSRELFVWHTKRLLLRWLLFAVGWSVGSLGVPGLALADGCPWGALGGSSCSPGSYYVASSTTNPIFQINPDPVPGSDHAFLVVAVPVSGTSTTLQFSTTFSQSKATHVVTPTGTLGIAGGYALFVLNSGFGVTSGTAHTDINVTFGNFTGGVTAFPKGTIFVALGQDGAGVYSDLRLAQVPEGGATVVFLSFGLLWFAFLLRRTSRRLADP